MKLTPPEWRTAWYEEGLSERFAQEMSRLEKSAVRELGTSGEWVEQLVIELGQLTQNMIQLEGELPRPHQLRLAFERALKLAALSAHLTAALDRAVEHGPAVLRYSEPAAAPLAAPPNPSSVSPAPLPRVAPDKRAQPSAVPPASQAVPRPAPPQAAPRAAQAAHPAPPSLAPATRTNPQPGQDRRSAMDARPAPAASQPLGTRDAPALVNNLMEISQPMFEGSPGPMREMILALARRGLSLAEIEVVTEQPRHVVDAVLRQRG